MGNVIIVAESDIEGDIDGYRKVVEGGGRWRKAVEERTKQ